LNQRRKHQFPVLSEMYSPHAYPIHFSPIRPSSTSGYERLVYKYQSQFNSILLSTETASITYFQNMKQKN